MESQSQLGFMETTTMDMVSYKLVPWINWDDWIFVNDSLFSSSSSPDSIASALHRISAWRSRGCVPVVIEITASIIEIRQKDPFFRGDLTESSLESEDMLTMLYCMTIIRLVNCVVEKTRKKNEVSVAEAADVIGIPRMLIDIRHECSHRDLPSLKLVRVASMKALEWLKSNYWEPQRMAIPYPSDRTANLRKEIKSTIRELAFCLDVKQTARSSSSAAKGKRSKKQITKALKNFIRLYSSVSSEVVSLLLEFLLKALDSADLADLSSSSEVGNSTGRFQTLFDDWKPVITKVSNKEPEILVSLLKTVLQKIETREAVKYESGEKHLTSEDNAQFLQVEQLSCLFEWLVDNFKELKPSRHKISSSEGDGSLKDRNLPKSSLIDLLCKCLLLSSLGNNHLTTASLVLARMAGNNTLLEKLNKLASLHTSNVNFYEENSPFMSSETTEIFLSQQEASISQAAKKLEFFTEKLTKRSNLKTAEDNNTRKERWVVAKSWNPCPIGMLPSANCSSGLLPVLYSVDDLEELSKLPESKETSELNQCCGKREADCSVEVLDNSDVKKMKESEFSDEEDTLLEGVKGRLMIGGVWKSVTEEELLAIASSVRILV